jgi:hypothetical protein
MTHPDQDWLREKLRKAVPPVRETELDHDLWPAMLHRMQKTTVRVPWWDWALATVAVVALFLLPELIPAIFYHL